MNTKFRIYNKLNASIFDLIDGKSEVKQTIALGYLLSNDNQILQDFLKMKPLTKLIGKIDINKFSDIIISTEMISEGGKRADIVLQFYKDSKKDFAIIVEAKNISLNISPFDVQEQLNNYLHVQNFECLKGFKKYGCTLTKNDLIFNSDEICSISWNGILKILNTNSQLGKDFLKFLTDINGAMNFYEKEVYSIPASKTYEYLSNYPFIYECPNEGKYPPKNKPLYFAFRKEEGIMEKLFGLEQTVVLNPGKDFDAFMQSDYSQEIKDRIKAYCDKCWGEGQYADNEKIFFILSETNQINLPHKPRPPKNNSFRAYYTLAELLDTNKVIVETEQK